MLPHSLHPSAGPGPTSPLAVSSWAQQMTGAGLHVGCVPRAPGAGVLCCQKITKQLNKKAITACGMDAGCFIWKTEGTFGRGAGHSGGWFQVSVKPKNTMQQEDPLFVDKTVYKEHLGVIKYEASYSVSLYSSLFCKWFKYFKLLLL